MDYYNKELDKLLDEFHEVMHSCPLFSEDIDKIEKNDIRDINELLDKNDEFYLKKAIQKIKDLIVFIKTTSESIEKEYALFSTLASTWEKIELKNIDDNSLNKINNQVKKANDLIKSHNIDDLKEANKIMNNIIKMTK